MFPYEPPDQVVRQKAANRWPRFVWLIVALGLLLVVIGMAGALNRDYTHIFGVARIAWWARFEAFHIAAHLIIFFTLTLLVGWPLPANRRWLIWPLVLAATFLIETMQIVSRGLGLWPPVIRAALFDLSVNVVGAGLGWIVLRKASDWLSPTNPLEQRADDIGHDRR